MPAITMEPITRLPTERILEVDSSTTYQEILGFGGAFTEASAINWRKLSKADQDEVIQLYFGAPEDGGHGYTLGRVPINSCDFSPASYTFDDVVGDVDLEHFDHDVTHDVEVGMIPMMQQAQEAVKKRGQPFNIYGSPWSPPAWMKNPAWGMQSMLLSDSPNGLMPSMQRAWAKYFSKFISAYRKHGINLWGVTVQNEPEASVGWEACLWTPAYMASFVRDHLGPVLAAEQPGVKIIGFDHNKDHMVTWAEELYADEEAKKYFHGIGVHWYGGLNQQHLDATHQMAPDKIILATEACNCGGVVFKNAAYQMGAFTKGNFLPAWWTRAELLGLDILVDLAYWAVGWTDWNLVLDVTGGPNHLKNLCDANIIVDHDDLLKTGSPLIMQASYYYMGHFSRYLPPGSKRIALRNSVEKEDRALDPGDVKNGQAMLFAPCDGGDVQKWQFDEATGALLVVGTNDYKGSEGYGLGGECMAIEDPPGWIEGKIQSFACNHSLPTQKWAVRKVEGGSQIFNPPTKMCLTAVSTNGAAVGLDQGVKVVAGQLKPCLADGAASQTFNLENYDGQGFPLGFPVRKLSDSGGELCLQPQIVRVPHFDAVAFQTPEGYNTLIAINIGDVPVDFNLADKASQTGISHLTIPPHAIHTYRWKPSLQGTTLNLHQIPETKPTGLLTWLIGGCAATVAVLGTIGVLGRQLKWWPGTQKADDAGNYFAFESATSERAA